MNKSNLVNNVSKKLKDFKKVDVEEAFNQVTDLISKVLVQEKRVEIRGFGSFSVRKRAARLSRNPKTGTSITVDSKFYPYFRPSKSLRREFNK